MTIKKRQSVADLGLKSSSHLRLQPRTSSLNTDLNPVAKLRKLQKNNSAIDLEGSYSLRSRKLGLKPGRDESRTTITDRLKDLNNKRK